MTTTKPERQRNRRRRKQSSTMPYILGGAFLAIIGVIVAVVMLANNNKTKIEIKPFDGVAGQTDEGFWYKGQPDAPVKVVEFADYECPGCGRLEENLQPANFDENYIKTGKVQFIFKELPLTDIHPSAQFAAEVARCAGDQNMFWPVHDYIFASQATWSRNAHSQAIILDPASDPGADADQIQACVDSKKYTQAVTDSQLAAFNAGITSTPTVLLNGQPFDVRSVEQLLQAIDAIAPAQ